MRFLFFIIDAIIVILLLFIVFGLIGMGIEQGRKDAEKMEGGEKDGKRTKRRRGK